MTQPCKLRDLHTASEMRSCDERTVDLAEDTADLLGRTVFNQALAQKSCNATFGIDHSSGHVSEKLAVSFSRSEH
jgi:hypothetical protein